MRRLRTINLPHYRQRAGLTQLDLALEVGTTRETISRIENGQRFYSERLQRRIARALSLNEEEVPDAFGFPSGRGAQRSGSEGPGLRVVTTAPRRLGS